MPSEPQTMTVLCVEFNLPATFVTRGQIHNTDRLEYIREDEMEIDTPWGITISISYDEIRKRFELVAFDNCWDNHIATCYEHESSELPARLTKMIAMITPIRSGLIDELAAAIDRQRRLLSGEAFHRVYSSPGWDFTRDRNLIVLDYLKLEHAGRTPLFFAKETPQ